MKKNTVVSHRFELLRNVVVLMLLGLYSMSYGQSDPLATYDFDGVDLSESSSVYASGIANGNVSYECGVGDNSFAISLDGIGGDADSISLDPALKSAFENDFTLSFYFWLDERQGVETYSLLSIQSNCDRDSSLAITYSASLNEIRLEYARNIAENVFFAYKLDTDRCWHNLVFSKTGDQYSLYLNGNLAGSVRQGAEIALGLNAEILLGASPCDGLQTIPLLGRIDRVEFYDSALGVETLADLDLFADRIISQDTTLFEGDSYEIISGPSCASSIVWAPGNTLDDPSSLSPIATPTMTTDYAITYDHGNCISYDTVRVNVIQEDDIDCATLLLPTAFTPNNDNTNDVFGISNDFIVTDLQRFEIYDRWGMKLFETNQLQVNWDGSYKGTPMMPGTYVYKIEYSCRGDDFKKTGSFNLIK